MSGARSKQGCYTCRFRKKKCDEEHPICLSCRSRGIKCYGYGAKPDWFKRSNEPGWDNEVVRELRCSAEKNNKIRRNRNLMNDRPLLGGEDLKRGFPSVSIDRLSLKQNCSATTQTTFIGMPTALEYSRMIPKERIWWDSGFKNSYDIHSYKETDLLISYLDDVFPLQFGFYKLAPGLSEWGWFINLMSKSKSLLHASTSLAECLRSRKNIGGNLIEIKPTVELRKLTALTLQAVQQQINLISQSSGVALLSAVIEVQAAVTQLMSQELFKTIEGNWELHFQASRALFKTISKLNQPMETFHRQIPRKSSLLDIALANKNVTEETLSLEFFTTCFIWTDILINATFGMKKPLSDQSFDYLPILQTGRLQLGNMMGCQNWAMLIIAEISNLEYKHAIDAVSPEILSQICLTFEYRLRSGVTRLIRSRVSRPSPSIEVDSALVTEIFAFAALIHLHTIINSASYDQPNVRDVSVMAVSVLETLPSHLLIRVSWPLSILACMATVEEREIYRSVLARAAENCAEVGTAGRALKVAEICWALRDIGDPRGTNMRTAMKAMGLRILLA